MYPNTWSQQTQNRCGSDGDMYHGYARTLYAMLFMIYHARTTSYALSRWHLLCYNYTCLAYTCYYCTYAVTYLMTLCHGIS